MYYSVRHPSSETTGTPTLAHNKICNTVTKHDFRTIKKQKIIICVYLLFDNTAILLTMTFVAP